MIGENTQNMSPSSPNEGLVAKVAFLPDRVILTPAFGSSRERLNRKVQNEKTFRNITRDVPGLYHPRILLEDDKLGRYEIEKATGFNLTTSKSQIHGGGMVEFFRIPIPFKTDAMITYLKAISAANEAGYCFVDHKSDSVFIDPVRQRTSIVDADALEAQKNPWERELVGGIQKVLRSFFTRDVGQDDSWTLIPAGPSIVIDSLGENKSAKEAVAVLEGWRQGAKTIHYGDFGMSGTKAHFELLARPLKSQSLSSKIEATDFSNISDFQRDMLEADLYTADLFRREEPQSIDKFLLGIGR